MTTERSAEGTTGGSTESPTVPDSPVGYARAAHESPIGKVLGGTYRVVSLLGSGGMGEVYEVVHVRLNTRFAIKVLNWEDAASDTGLKRFQREAMAASSIGHDNIVQVVDFKVAEDGRPYMVMEYLEGESLRSAIRKEGCLPVKRALKVIVQVLDALEKAHQRGIVHRDLKPANIFLTAKFGWPDVVKILDFGVSKVMGDMLLATQKGAFLGTPAYMAPEQIRSEDTVDHRADIYALGVLLYEMLTGKRPFRGGMVSLAYSVISEPPVTPRKWVPEIPQDIEEVILKALAKKSGERFQSAAEMLRAIRQTQAGQSLESVSGPSATAASELDTGKEAEPGESISRSEPRAGSVSTQPVTQAVGTRWSAVAAVTLGLVAAAVVFYVVWKKSTRPTRKSGSRPHPEKGLGPKGDGTGTGVAQPRPSGSGTVVAVLPFENLSGDSKLNWLGTGIADTVTGDLSQIRSIHVLARRRVGVLLGKIPAEHRSDPARAGRALGARWVISGSYQKSGGIIRITARFFDVIGTRSLKPLKVQGPLAQIFGIQDKIVLHAVDVLRVAVEKTDRERLARKTTRSLEAYRALSTAMSACQRSLWQACFRGLDRAIGLDKKYSWAYIQRGVHRYFYSGYSRFDLVGLAGAASDFRRGVKLRPDFERYLAFASVIHLMRAEFKTASDLITSLLSKHPGDALVLNFAGHIFAGSVLQALVLDDLPRGIRAYRRYLGWRSSGAWAHVNLTEKYLAARKFQKALEEAARAGARMRRMERQGMAKEHPPAHVILKGLALDGLGKHAHAERALKRGLAVLDRWGSGLYNANMYRWLAHHKLALMARARRDRDAQKRHATMAAQLEQRLVRKHPLKPGRAYLHPLLDMMMHIDLERAARLFRRDEKAAPHDPMPPLFLSTAYLLKGKFAEAGRAARRAEKLAKNNPELLPFIKKRLDRCRRRESLATSLWP